MSQQLKNGKAPRAMKYDIDFEADDLKIDEVLKTELDNLGLDYRFIDWKKAKAMGGRSRSGWIVYRRESEDPALQGLKALADPDGLVRHGSMVLAVKTKTNAKKQRDKIAKMNATLKNYQKIAAEELREQAKKLSGDTVVLEGYDANSK